MGDEPAGPKEHTAVSQLEAEVVMEVALPDEHRSPVAEAWGANAALQLLLRGPDMWPRTARVVGDNLAAVRYCAAQGRLHSPDIQGVLDSVLGRVLLGGWRLTWEAVRRRWNRRADHKSGRQQEEC